MGIFDNLKIATRGMKNSIDEHGFINAFRPKKIVQSAEEKYKAKLRKLNLSKSRTKSVLKDFSLVKLNLFNDEFSRLNSIMAGIYNINLKDEGRIRNGKLGFRKYILSISWYHGIQISTRELYKFISRG